MQLYNQIALKENEVMYNYLKMNSEYFKLFSRDTINFKLFSREMNIKYKKRTTDKINNVLESMDIVNSILDILK